MILNCLIFICKLITSRSSRRNFVAFFLSLYFRFKSQNFLWIFCPDDNIIPKNPIIIPTAQTATWQFTTIVMPSNKTATVEPIGVFWLNGNLIEMKRIEINLKSLKYLFKKRWHYEITLYRLAWKRHLLPYLLRNKDIMTSLKLESML